jgi:hypothetical protein
VEEVPDAFLAFVLDELGRHVFRRVEEGLCEGGSVFVLQRRSALTVLRASFGSHVRLGSEFMAFGFFGGRRGHIWWLRSPYG